MVELHDSEYDTGSFTLKRRSNFFKQHSCFEAKFNVKYARFSCANLVFFDIEGDNPLKES